MTKPTVWLQQGNDQRGERIKRDVARSMLSQAGVIVRIFKCDVEKLLGCNEEHADRPCRTGNKNLHGVTMAWEVVHHGDRKAGDIVISLCGGAFYKHVVPETEDILAA